MQICVEILENEYWWGGVVNDGHKMPLHRGSECIVDMSAGQDQDQFAPLFLSSKGRYIWSERPFVLRSESGQLTCQGPDQIQLCEGFENLRGAYLAACEKHFPFTGKTPPSEFFTMPQYNTWMELGTEQTADNIRRYAKGLCDHGLPPGVLMIDEGWQEEYGIFEFNRNKIPDPATLIGELKEWGFSVMLWVTPFVSSAGPRYKWLADRGYLICDENGEPVIRRWWNGWSAVMDLTNPETVEWYHSQLQSLMDRYGVDGFKFDAGDCHFYRDNDNVHTPMLAREQTATFNALGERYAFNEFRAAWKFGGHGIVARLQDKHHRWQDFGLDVLIPHTVMQGLLGYAYCCPDMVGGGAYGDIKDIKQIDQELFVRWAQASALMGMLQLSVAPWRVLTEKNTNLVLAAADLHNSFGLMFWNLAQDSAQTGEPIVRHMDYVFPGEGFETEQTQFMLGDSILVAPVLERGAESRKVRLPKGSWRDWKGTVYPGGTMVTVSAPLNELPWFRIVATDSQK